jgi:putative hydrolase of the HAD superfamily
VRRLYLTATDRLSADPADCVYVGDGADGELAGAAAVGLTTLRITELNNTDPNWQGPTLTAIGDLPALLRQQYANFQADNDATGARH